MTRLAWRTVLLVVGASACLTEFPDPVQTGTSSNGVSSSATSTSSSAGGAGGGAPTCPDGFGDCSPEPGCETPLVTDDACGACGRACLETSTCTMGICSALEVAATAEPFEVMVDATDVYWTDYFDGTVSRRRRDGTDSIVVLYDGDSTEAWHASLGASDVFVSTRNDGRLLRVPKDGSDFAIVATALDTTGLAKAYGVAASAQDDVVVFGVGEAKPRLYAIRSDVEEAELTIEDLQPTMGVRLLSPVGTMEFQQPFHFRRSGAFVFFHDFRKPGIWRVEADLEGTMEKLDGRNVVVSGLDVRDAGTQGETLYFAVAQTGSEGLYRAIGRPIDAPAQEDRWAGAPCTDVIGSEVYVYWIAQNETAGGGRILRQGRSDVAGTSVTIYQAAAGELIKGLAVDDDALYFGTSIDADGAGGAAPSGKILRTAP